MKHIWYILVIIFALTACRNRGPLLEESKNGITLSLYMEPEEPLAGNEIHLRYRIQGRGYEEIRYPQVHEDFGGMQVLDWVKDDKGAELILLPMNAGEYSLPGISFFLIGEESFDLHLPDYTLTVPSQLTAESSLKEADKPVTIGWLRSWQWALLASGFILLSVLLFYFFFYSHRKKKHYRKLSEELDLRLSNLNLPDIYQKQGIRSLYRTASFEIRYFCDKVFNTRTLEKTSGEFQSEILTLPVLRQAIKPWFIEFCQRSDRVKYAAATVLQEEVERDLEQSLSLLKDIQRYQKERESYESA